MQLYRAKSERQCGACKGKIAKGEAYYGFRERATCSHEAMHAGSLYPKRYRCRPCGEKRKAAGAPAEAIT
jgi:hypothetical protein